MCTYIRDARSMFWNACAIDVRGNDKPYVMGPLFF